MTKEESKKLYEGKFFYEIVKPAAGGIQLFGPFDNIYYVNDKIELPPEWSGAKFVQVVDGIPTVVFTEKEILITNRVL